MSNCVLKPRPDVDEYVVWESIVEAPVFLGTRTDTAAYLLEAAAQRAGVGLGLPQSPDQVEERLARADARGTSAIWADGLSFGSEDRREIYQQMGWVRVVDMPELVRHINEDLPLADLVTPFDDEDAGPE